jgi:hypothetical protein
MSNWSWKFSGARVTDENGLKDVVKDIGYEATGVRNGQSYTISGRAALNGPDPANFKPFENLTEQDLVAFINSKVQTEVYDRMASDLQAYYDRQAQQEQQQKPFSFEND